MGSGVVTLQKASVTCQATAGENLSDFRQQLLAGVAKNLLNCAGYDVIDHCQGSTHLHLHYTTGRLARKGQIALQCSYVVTLDGEKTAVTTQEFKKLRVEDMRQMSEHKYWEGGHEDTVDILADASMAVDLLQAKTNCPVKINMEPEVHMGMREVNSKGGTFLLYNYARLKTIEKKFEDMVGQNQLPPLPDCTDIDTGLLTKKEEWSLLFDYLLEYPMVLSNIMKRCDTGAIHQHTLLAFLFKLCHSFSTYYAHIKVLQEPKPHLQKIIYARVTLIKAIERVLAHALKILNIVPLNFM